MRASLSSICAPRHEISTHAPLRASHRPCACRRRLRRWPCSHGRGLTLTSWLARAPRCFTTYRRFGASMTSLHAQTIFMRSLVVNSRPIEVARDKYAARERKAHTFRICNRLVTFASAPPLQNGRPVHRHHPCTWTGQRLSTSCLGFSARFSLLPCSGPRTDADAWMPGPKGVGAVPLT